MSLALIRSAFESRLATWAATQSLPIAYENISFTPPATKHCRVYLLPAKTDSVTLDGTARTYKGIFQVSIVMPLNGGAGAAQSLAIAIAGLYPSLFTHSGIIINTSPMSEGVAQVEPNYYVLPIRIIYHVETIS